MPAGETTKIQCWIVRMRQGDPAAMDEMFAHFQDRFVRLTRTMLGGYPPVRNREETGDVYQESAIRMMAALKAVEPRDTQHFFRLAATQIRRELAELAKRHRERAQPGQRDGRDSYGHDNGDTDLQVRDETDGPDRLAMWTEFHERAARLPEPLRNVFDLVFYEGISQIEAAELLGVSERTIHSRWQKARLALHDALEGTLPWE